MAFSGRIRCTFPLLRKILSADSSAVCAGSAADLTLKKPCTVPLSLFGGSGNYASSPSLAASKANDLDKVETEILDVVEASKKSPLFSQFIKDLSVPRETRVKVINEISSEAGVSDVTKNFPGSSTKLRRYVNRNPAAQPNIYGINRFYLVRTTTSNYSTEASQQRRKEETKKDISTVEDPFDAPTYNIPEKPVTFTEGASYSLIILAGLGVAGLAAYAVFRELIFEPKEYKIFGKALERVQNDSQVTVRIGHPVTGYGQESKNRAARQRIPNRVWTDEDGVEHVEVSFYIRGPHGFGKVYTEMFKNKVDKKWTFTYLIVEIKSPTPAQLMLESYVPA